MTDSGNIAFMLVATALVMIMTPGLAFFYGGLVHRKSVLTIMMQSFISIGWATFLWIAVGYSLTFSGDYFGIIGNLDHMFLRGISAADVLSETNALPLYIFIAFQMMFAIITPALITGAFADRVRFGPYLVFLTLWLLFVYFPIAHMAWGGGLFSQWGVLDFAGGTVVHATAGFAALASVLFVGKRKVRNHKPHNLPFVALGTAMLWFGWFGFNAGSQLSADSIAALAFLNTHIAASIAGLVWLVLAWLKEGKPSFSGFLIGSVAGLVAITPACGFVTPTAAMLFGVIAGVGCFYAVQLRGKMKLDDALDVWGIHGIGGVLGVLALGVFASTAANPAGQDGLLAGNLHFFVMQVLSVILATGWAFLFTYFSLGLINLFVKVRVSDRDSETGLDLSLHGESAYDGS